MPFGGCSPGGAGVAPFGGCSLGGAGAALLTAHGAVEGGRSGGGAARGGRNGGGISFGGGVIGLAFMEVALTSFGGVWCDALSTA